MAAVTILSASLAFALTPHSGKGARGNCACSYTSLARKR